MINKTIFRNQKLPIAREKERLPIFLDLSFEGIKEDDISCIKDNKVVFGIVDVVILLPHHIPALSSINQEVWLRTDYKEKNKFTLDSTYLSQCGVSGIISCLALGKSASDEANNVQYLAYLRSLCLEVGFPLVVDIHIPDSMKDTRSQLETVELSLNLAVELGCNIAIIPTDHYLFAANQIKEIAEIPILLRQSSHQIIENAFLNAPQRLFDWADGIILGGPYRCDQLEIEVETLGQLMDSLRIS